jgi:NAD(P)-dependent dehydrogenase (short-subunit alcohol dehydrogenase family)
MADERPLAGKVALVAGATRAAGRGIAIALAEAGAEVWCTGRSAEGHAATPGRPETLEETAGLVEAAGARAVLVRCDHTDEAQVAALMTRVKAEAGRLDVLVNDVWGGDALIRWEAKFWQIDAEAARTLAERSILSHWVTAKHAAPLMVEAGRGLIVEVTDGDMPGYRGQWLYDWVKSSVIRMGYAMAWDLVGTGVTALTVTPGFLRSEEVLQRQGVTEANWREAVARDPTFEQSETPQFIGRGIAALAADPHVAARAGTTTFACDLARDYGFTDLDGRVPDFWAANEQWIEARIAAGEAPDRRERFMGVARYSVIHPLPARREQAQRYAERYGLQGLGAGLRPA